MIHLLKAFKPVVADFLSTIVFLIVLDATDKVVLATLVGIAIGIAQFVWYWLRGNKIELMQWASLGLVIVMGGATLFTRDARFMMVKPSIAGVAIATVMLRRGWQNRYLPAAVHERVAPETLIVWGYLWSALYFAMAGANLLIALEFGRHAWEAFTAIVPTLVPAALIVIEYLHLHSAVRRKPVASSSAAAE